MVTVSTNALAVAMSSAAADPYTIPVNGVESDSHVATALETVVDTIALEVPSNIDVLENNGTISSSALFSTDPSSRTAAARASPPSLPTFVAHSPSQMGSRARWLAAARSRAVGSTTPLLQVAGWPSSAGSG